LVCLIKMAESDNHRWWESYLVRYLAGNIFAVLVLFYLVAFHGGEIQDSICGQPTSSYIEICNKDFSQEVYSFIFQSSEVSTTNNENVLKWFKGEETKEIITTDIGFVQMLIMGIFGFLYMYISSIPIYLMHIFRGGVINIFPKKELGSVCVRDIFTNTEFTQLSTKIRSDIKKDDIKLCEVFKLNNIKFCRRCSINEKEKYDLGFTKEYLTTYKHIREHGNAFGIILMEIIFACLLIKSNFSIYFIFSWVSLGFVGWFLGIKLEFLMVGKDYKKWYEILIYCFIIILIIINFFLFIFNCLR